MRDKEEIIIEQLGILMSNISEDCNCAGWLYGTEYFVPELCKRACKTNLDQPWGHGSVSPSLAKKLIQLSNELDSWVDINEKGSAYIKFNPYPIPKKYKVNLDREFKVAQQKNT